MLTLHLISTHIRSLSLCLMITGITIAASPHVIVWDLDGVLVNVSRAGVGWEITKRAPFALTSQAMRHGSPQKAAFAMMDHLYPTKHVTCTAYDPKGPELPALMHDWMAGVPGCDSHTNLQHLQRALIREKVHTTDRNAYMAIFQAIFDPDIRGRNTHICPEGYGLLKRLQSEYPGYTHMILSNFDTACFNHVYNAPQTQELFQHFSPERIHISADMGTMKPDPEIFTRMCEYHGISPKDCIFIDDQSVNTQAAEQAGMYAVHFSPDTAYDAFTHITNYLEHTE